MKHWSILLLLLAALATTACTTKVSNDSKTSVVSTFYPIEFLVQEISKSQATVTNLVPSGFEPHDYELTPKDVETIQSADLLVANGSLEPWLQDLEQNLEKFTVKILNLTEALKLLEGEAQNSNADPHVWLDPILMSTMTDVIMKALMEVDPSHEAVYLSNAETLKRKFLELDTFIKARFSSCEKKSFVTSHAAFSYFAKRYGLIQFSIAGLSPEQEPSAQQLKEVIDFVRKNNVEVIFFETLVSPELSETIASEVGAKTMVLNPIEGLTPEQKETGEDYFSLMKTNVENLGYALNCQ